MGRPTSAVLAGELVHDDSSVNISTFYFMRGVLAVSAQDCLAYMQNGSELIKVRSNSRQYHRIFSLSSDVSEIRWQPTSKKPHKARSK